MFYIALMMHGASGFINKQMNTKQVPYGDIGTCIPLNSDLMPLSMTKKQKLEDDYKINIVQGTTCWLSSAEEEAMRQDPDELYSFENVIGDSRPKEMKRFCTEFDVVEGEDPEPIYCFNQNKDTGFDSIITENLERFDPLPGTNPRLGTGTIPCCNCLGCTEPVMVHGGPKTWQWVIGPLLLYLLERGYR